MKVIIPGAIILSVASFFVPMLGVAAALLVAPFLGVLALIALIRGWILWAHIDSRLQALFALFLAIVVFVCGVAGTSAQYSGSRTSDDVIEQVEDPQPTQEPAPIVEPEPVVEQPAPEPVVEQPAPEPPAPVVTYKNCGEVRAAGAAPLHRDQPGYSTRLDGDGDGWACET